MILEPGEIFSAFTGIPSNPRHRALLHRVCGQGFPLRKPALPCDDPQGGPCASRTRQNELRLQRSTSLVFVHTCSTNSCRSERVREKISVYAFSVHHNATF